MRRYSRVIALLVALLALAGQATSALGASTPSPEAASPPTPSAGSRTQADIEREKAALKSKIQDADVRAASIKKQISASDSKRAELDRQNLALKTRLAAEQGNLQRTKADLDAAKTELSGVEAGLLDLSNRMGALQQRFRERQRITYKLGGIGHYFELLISAGSFREFLGRLVFVRKVITVDRSRLNAVQQLKAQMQRTQTEVDRRARDISAELESIESQKRTISSLQISVSENRKQVVGELTTRKGLLGQIEDEKAAYLKQMRRLEIESASIAALLRSRQKGQVFQAGGTKQLAWPTSGPVSSGFGYRVHPIFGDRRLHSGIDISAPAGQTVIAAEAGVVVFAGAQSGYGNTVVIDHGNALATLYAHLSAVKVSSGQKVTRTQPVGAVGCTGYCTGPHLHFETRVNGEPVDPMRFF